MDSTNTKKPVLKLTRNTVKNLKAHTGLKTGLAAGTEGLCGEHTYADCTTHITK
jgi:hypothetical protein